jgi:kinesin family protein 11
MSTMDYALRAKSILNRPEANAKLTKKEVMKEFTFEIEQLKKDLLAAREKNGIFLSQERHDDMIQTLATQKDEIEELTVMMQVTR